MLAAMLWLNGTVQAQDDGELRALIEQHHYREAYALAAKQTSRLGEPGFDFYFGIAAIETGHAAEGVLALERFLFHAPENRSARLLLARGYFLLDENGRAREEFEAVLYTDPGGEREAIERFLDAIRARESRYRPGIATFAEIGIGYDSNANSGVTGGFVNLPVLGVVAVGSGGVAKGDAYAVATLGLQGSHPLAPGFAIVGSATLDARQYRHDSAFDQGMYAANAGVSWIVGGQVLRATAGQLTQTFGGARLRSVTGANFEWTRQFGPSHLVALGAQEARLDYTGTNSVRDSNFGGFSLNWRWSLPTAWQSALAVSGNSGRERNRDAARDDLSRDITGVRLGIAVAPTSSWSIAAGLSWQRSDYLQPDLVLDTTRHDRYRALDASVAYSLTRRVSLRSELVVSRNRSNLELYAYERNMLALKLRYDF